MKKHFLAILHFTLWSIVVALAPAYNLCLSAQEASAPPTAKAVEPEASPAAAPVGGVAPVPIPPSAQAPQPVVARATPAEVEAGPVKLTHPPFELPNRFSAVVTITQGTRVNDVKFFVDKGRVRIETKSKDIVIAMIIDPKSKEVIRIVPDRKVFVKTKLTSDIQRASDLNSAWNDSKVSWEKQTGLIISGIPCESYKLSKPDSDEGPGRSYTLYLNPANHLPVLVKIKSETGEIEQQWSNVNVGPQLDALFKIPEGFTEKVN